MQYIDITKLTKEQKQKNLKEYNKLNKWFKDHCAKTGTNPVTDYKYKNKYQYKKPTEAGIQITK